MNQQFSVEYLGVKPGRYNRLPTLHTNQIFNLSQELQTSRTKRNLLKPKLQALSHKREDSKNFYHHTTIYNVREFKELSKGPNVQEQNFAKYNELQTKLMVADFKKKVDAFLTKNNYKHNLIGSKITNSLKELESFQSTNNEEQLNRSLCSNKYTIRTEYKSMKAMEIFVIGNNKIVARQVISSELIQQRLLKQMEHFLKDERYNYDLKMQTMIQEYEDIVSKIKEQAHTIKIPDKYIIQMSDYNEYYQMQEDPAIEFFKNKLDIITDQIIQEIQQSKKTTPRIQSHHTSEQMDIVVEQSSIPQIEEIIKTEPVQMREEDDTPKQIQIEDIIMSEKKPTHRKPRTKKKPIIQQNRQDRTQSEISSSQSELMDTSMHQSQAIAEAIRRKKEPEPARQLEISIKIDEEEQDQFQAEIKQDQKIQEINKKREDFNNKYKPKTHSRRVTEDVVMDRQDPIQLEVPKEKLLETLSERPVEDLEPIEDIIQTKKEELYQFQREEALQEADQINETALNDEKENDTSNKTSLHDNTLKPPDIREAVDLWDSKKSSPRTVVRQRPNNQNQVVQKQEKPTQEEIIDYNPRAEIEFPKEEDQQKNEEEEAAQQKKFETVNSQQSINYYKIIEQKMKVIEENLNKNSLDIIDLLLASKVVYDVDIDNYKIGKPNSSRVDHPSFVFQSKQDEHVFVSQVLWRREVQEVIPRINEMNRFKVVQLDEFDDYIGDLNKINDDMQRIEEKQNESDDNDNS